MKLGVQHIKYYMMKLKLFRRKLSIKCYENIRMKNKLNNQS